MDGILIINKEKGYTSNDVVRKVKKILNCSKVGHTGTLDPNATGVLPLLLGNATKISKYLINHDKEYEAILQLGTKTTTADGEGEILEKTEINTNKIELMEVERVLKSFVGDYSQVPPIYSAIKVNGKKLYQYARNGEKIELEPRNIKIYDIKLLNIDKENQQIKFYVKCSKGTYIRTLCEDIASGLNTIGYMKELNRVSVGEFNINKSIKIDNLNQQAIENIDGFITIENFFRNCESIVINDENDLKKYLNGVNINVENLKDNYFRIYFKYKFIGIGIVEKGKLKRDIVI